MRGFEGVGEEVERRTVSGDDSDPVRGDGRASHGRGRLYDYGEVQEGESWEKEGREGGRRNPFEEEEAIPKHGLSP